MRMGRVGRREYYKKAQGNYWNDEYIHYVSSCVYVWYLYLTCVKVIIKLYTLNIYCLLYVSIIPQQIVNIFGSLL